jgi:hypothetical protein
VTSLTEASVDPTANPAGFIAPPLMAVLEVLAVIPTAARDLTRSRV